MMRYNGTHRARVVVPLLLAISLMLGLPAVAGAAGVTGAIEGTVRSGVGGGPIAGVCVTATPRSGSVLRGTTGPDGAYRIPGLAPGPYLVEFGGCGGLPTGDAPVWFDQRPSAASAPSVEVVAGATVTKVDGQLGESGAIRGVVSRQGGGHLSGVCVSVASASAPADRLETTTTGADGVYRLPGLIAGSYVVNFGGCGVPGNQIAQWYDGQTTAGSATPVAVGWGRTTPAIDAALFTAGAVRGVVRSHPGGGPLAGVCVEALTPTDPTGPPVASGTTDSTGVYKLGSLVAGDYLVDFGACGGLGSHLPQWYGDAPSADASTPVLVSNGRTTAGIDASLTATGRISGRVTTNAPGTVYREAGPVCLSVFTSSDLSGPPLTHIQLNLDRYRPVYYVIPDAPVGSDLLELAACRTPSRWQTTWYGGPTEAAAIPVKVATDQGTTRIDFTESFVPPPPPPPGVIQGVVTRSPGGGRLTGVCVAAVSAADRLGSPAATAVTDANGYYDMSVAAGSYVVDFGGCGGLPVGVQPQWYQNQTSAATATALAVVAGQRTRAVDAALRPVVAGT